MSYFTRNDKRLPSPRFRIGPAGDPLCYHRAMRTFPVPWLLVLNKSEDGAVQRERVTGVRFVQLTRQEDR